MYYQDLCKNVYILTEVFVRYRYSPDVTHCVFFFSLTIVPFWDRIFKACLHLQFQHECTKYAYILVQQGEVYTTGGLVLKFILFCSPEVYRVVLPQSIALILKKIPSYFPCNSIANTCSGAIFRLLWRASHDNELCSNMTKSFRKTSSL